MFCTESCQNFDNKDILITKATWKTELSNTFLHNLNEDDVECFVEKLALVSTNTVTKEDVEVLAFECSSLLFNAADAAGMISHKTERSPINPKRVSRKAAKKPWFNDECCCTVFNIGALKIIEEGSIMPRIFSSNKRQAKLTKMPK